MARVFGALRPEQRQLVWLAYVERASHKEISAAIGVRERSVVSCCTARSGSSPKSWAKRDLGTRARGAARLRETSDVEPPLDADVEKHLAEWMEAFAAEPIAQPPSISATEIWQKAELLRRWDAQRKAAAPIEMGDRAQVGVGLAGAVALLVWVSRQVPVRRCRRPSPPHSWRASCCSSRRRRSACGRCSHGNNLEQAAQFTAERAEHAEPKDVSASSASSAVIRLRHTPCEFIVVLDDACAFVEHFRSRVAVSARGSSGGDDERAILSGRRCRLRTAPALARRLHPSLPCL